MDPNLLLLFFNCFNCAQTLRMNRGNRPFRCVHPKNYPLPGRLVMYISYCAVPTQQLTTNRAVTRLNCRIQPFGPSARIMLQPFERSHKHIHTDIWKMCCARERKIKMHATLLGRRVDRSSSFQAFHKQFSHCQTDCLHLTVRCAIKLQIGERESARYSRKSTQRQTAKQASIYTLRASSIFGAPKWPCIYILIESSVE